MVETRAIVGLIRVINADLLDLRDQLDYNLIARSIDHERAICDRVFTQAVSPPEEIVY